MKKIKLFFALFAMLALGVTNAWGAEVTETIKMIGFAGSTATSYVNQTKTGASDKGTAMVAYAFNPKTGQVRGNKTTVAGASITSDDANKNWSLYNSQAMGGAIKSITITQTATGSNKFQNEMYVSLGTTTQGAVTAITNAQKHTSLDANTITFDIDPSKGYTYFKLLSTKKFGTGTLAGVEVKVTYETAGGDSGSTETAVSVPTFSVPEGTFYSPINVELSCETADAEIYYTLDETTPSSTSEKYTTAIAISETTTVKAIAVKDGLTDSEVATATYTKGETVTSYDIDFETNALEAYVNWDFSNIAVATTEITAKEGTYYGNTCGKTSASIKTKTAIPYPGTLTFYTSKESGNTTSSNWIVQVSENGSTWTDVTSFDATTGSKGTWTERTADLSDYENVYVQISYSGTTAIRAIDEISLAQGVAPVKYTLTIESPENGTLLVTNGGASVASGDQFKAGTSLVVTPTPASGYLFESLTVDGSAVELTDGTYTFNMPAADVTIAATFKENEKPAATLTLSKNGVEETFPGSWKQDDVVTLPSITSDCVKEFVGWSADANCAIEPEYKAGDEYTLASTTQTLYAVYADGESGEASLTKMTSSDALANGDKIVIVANGTKLGMYQETISTSYVKNWELGAEEPTISELDEKKIWDVVAVDGSWKLGDATNGYLLNEDDNNELEVSTTNSSTWTIAWETTGFTFKSDQGRYLACRTDLTSDKQNLYRMNGKSVSSTNGSVYEMSIYKYIEPAPTYSDYSTTCAAAPKAEVNPTEVTATAAGVEGKVTVTYENVNTANVAVALYNDEACTEEFNAGWLTASLDGDKNIAYTVAATTLYTERKAYIQLTAPETTGATDPDVVVIPVTQAAKEKVFASLEELLAAITPTKEGVEVTVTLTNEVIQDFYTSGSYRNGIALNVPYQDGVKVIEIYCKDVPAEWVKGGKVSGTITCPWKLYNSTWELCPTAWNELIYTAPATVKSIAVSGTPTKTTYVDGEAFDPTGLVVTATLTDDSKEPIEFALVDWTFDPETLSKGETSVSVVATYNTMASAAYVVTGLTVNDIPTKTVAEFIAAGGTRCYLEGIVSGLTEGNSMKYGNFDLTDASGKIYVYGCLNAAGEEQKFAELSVKNGDKIKVIADEYELYGGTKDEAIDVQYVSHISAATITIADITMEVEEVTTISATVEPAGAAVTYTIKENEANAISLSGNTITALAEGTATITATVAKGATYLGNSVDFTVTVGPKTESDEVVILAEYNGQWYALKAETGSSTNSLAALEVEYFNGILYNVDEADKASITWKRTIVGNFETFQYGDKYLKGSSSTNLFMEDGTEGKYQWDKDTHTMLIGSTNRTFLYQGTYFKNYAISNAGRTVDGTTYSALPVVTAPVYATGDVVYTRTVTLGNYGTICIPYASSSYSGAEFYEVSWLQKSGETPVNLYLDQLAEGTHLVAGKPYIFRATSTELTVTCTGDAVAAPAEGANGLTGSFDAIPEGGLTGMFVIAQNKFWTATAEATAPANRAYIKPNQVPTSEPAKLPGRRRVALGAAGENEATGMDNITTTDTPVKVIENGQLIIIRNGEKFNVQGQKL